MIPQANRHGRRQRVHAFLLVLAFASFAFACAPLPTQEMSDARQAINSARKAGAGSLAGAELRSAERLLSQARRALNDRDLAASREHAVAAKEEAIRARKAALLAATPP